MIKSIKFENETNILNYNSLSKTHKAIEYYKKEELWLYKTQKLTIFANKNRKILKD